MLMSTRAVPIENIRESQDVFRSRGPPIETEKGFTSANCRKVSLLVSFILSDSS